MGGEQNTYLKLKMLTSFKLYFKDFTITMEGFENGLLVVPDGEVPGRTEKINLKNLYEIFRDSNSHGGLVPIQFICALEVFFGVNIEIIKNTISELHQNLSYKILSGAKDFE